MTILSSTVPRKDYTGGGGVTLFAYTWKINDVTELAVYQSNTLRTYGIDYTITGVGTAGGNVSFNVAPANGEAIAILSNVMATQQTVWTENDPNPAKNIENAVDKDVRLIQQLQEVDQRSLKFAIASLVKNVTVLDPVSGQFLRYKDATTVDSASVVPVGSLGVPVSTANGGTGVSYASAAALAKGLGLALWGGSTGGSATMSVAAGVGTLPDPLTTNIFTVASALTSLTPNPLVGTTLLIYWNAASVVATSGGGITLIGGSNYTFTTGDISVLCYIGGGSWIEVERRLGSTVLGLTGSRPNHGRLTLVSATQIKFGPYNGTLLPVKVGGVWQLRDIGAGVTSGNPTTTSNFVNGVASQALAANTTYLVTVFSNAGVLTLDFLTTLTHAVDATTGVEIKNGDDTRTVVGLVRTNATPNFTDFLTLSWFNRRVRSQQTSFSADRSTTSATFVEINTEIQNSFLCWAEESVHVQTGGTFSNTANATVNSGIGIDSTTVVTSGLEASQNGGAGVQMSFAMSCTLSLSEGYHTATVIGLVGSGTGTWHTTGTGHAKTTITVAVRG